LKHVGEAAGTLLVGEEAQPLFDALVQGRSMLARRQADWISFYVIQVQAEGRTTDFGYRWWPGASPGPCASHHAPTGDCVEHISGNWFSEETWWPTDAGS